MSADVHSFTEGAQHADIALELEISLDPTRPHRGVAVYRFSAGGMAVMDLGPHVTIDHMIGQQAERGRHVGGGRERSRSRFPAHHHRSALRNLLGVGRT